MFKSLGVYLNITPENGKKGTNLADKIQNNRLQTTRKVLFCRYWCVICVYWISYMYVNRSSRGILLKFYRWRYQANAPLKPLSDIFTTIPIFTTLNAHCCPVVVFLEPAGGGEPGCMGPVYSFNINRKSQLRSSSGKAWLAKGGGPDRNVTVLSLSRSIV